MQEDKVNKDNEEHTEISNTPSRAARLLEQRIKKRRRQVSFAKLISYIIALIVVILLMYLLKR